MKQMGSTEFQKAYPRLTEPHEVTALGRRIGIWYPAGTEPRMGLPKIDPEASFGQARPAPKPKK